MEDELDAIDKGIHSVDAIRDFAAMSHLRVINLHMNKLMTTQGFSPFTRLVELDLSANEISVIEGLEQLQSLRLLNLSCNYIASLSGLPELRSLQVLNVSMNAIASLGDVSGKLRLPALAHIDLSMNKIAQPVCIEALRALPALRSLCLSTELDGDACNLLACRHDYPECVAERLPKLEFIDDRVLFFDPKNPNLPIGGVLEASKRLSMVAAAAVAVDRGTPSRSYVPEARHASASPLRSDAGLMPSGNNTASEAAVVSIAPPEGHERSPDRLPSRKRRVSRGMNTEAEPPSVCTDCEEALPAARAQAAAALTDLKQMKTSNGAARAALSKLQAELSKRHAAAADVASERDSLRQVVREHERRIDDLKRALDAAQLKSKDQLNAEAARAAQIAAAAEERLKSVQDVVRCREEEIAALKADSAAVHAALHETQVANDGLISEVAAAKDAQLSTSRDVATAHLSALHMSKLAVELVIQAEAEGRNALAACQEAMARCFLESRAWANDAAARAEDEHQRYRAATMALSRRVDALRQERERDRVALKSSLQEQTQPQHADAAESRRSRGMQTLEGMTRSVAVMAVTAAVDAAAQSTLHWSDIERLQHDRDALEGRLEQERRTMLTLNDELRTTSHERDAAVIDLHRSTAEIAQLKVRVVDLEQDVADKLGEAQSIEAEARSKIDEQRDRIRRLVETVVTLREHIAEVDMEHTTECRSLQNTIGEIRADRDRAEAFATLMSQRATALSDQLDELRSNIKNLA